MNLADIVGGFLTGGVGGLASGFLGVTSGGILVPLLILILGKDQHVAQGISLVAQVVPTSLSGVRNYSQSGHRVSLRWLIWLAIGFCTGGGIGALLATHVPTVPCSGRSPVISRSSSPSWCCARPVARPKAVRACLQTCPCTGRCLRPSAPWRAGHRGFSESAADWRSPR
jgi:hypothetical protein